MTEQQIFIPIHYITRKSALLDFYRNIELINTFQTGESFPNSSTYQDWLSKSSKLYPS